MIPPAFSTRIRRLGLGLLLLAVPACGLNEYETLMRDAQERKERFDLEQKYLGLPVDIPTQKDKEDREVPLASVFFRPPKGVDPKPQQRAMMWQYRADPRSDFVAVELAFGEDNKDFARSVLDNYGNVGLASGKPRQIAAPGRKSPMNFETWEFSNDQRGYSINILKDSSKPLAIIYMYNKPKADSALKVIELSLQSLGFDQYFNSARQRFDQRSPWKLQAQPSP